MSEQPPENGDPFYDYNPVEAMEFDLPVSEEFPPDEAQARLEAPTSFITVSDAAGNDYTLVGGAATEPGVEKVWTEVPEMAKRTDAAETAGNDLSAGQVQQGVMG